MNLHDAPIPSDFGEPRSTENIGLLDVLSVLYDSKWAITAWIAVAAAGAAAYAYLVPPTYEATTLIQIEEGASNSTGIGALRETDAGLATRSTPGAEISILRSNLVLEHTIDRLGLDVHARPKYVPLIGYWLSTRATEPSEPAFLGLKGYVAGNETIDVGKFVVPHEVQGQTFTVRLTANGYSLIRPNGATVFNGQIGKPEAFDLDGKPAQILIKSMAGRVGAEFLLKQDAQATALKHLQQSLTVEEQGKQSGVLRAKLTGKDPLRLAATLNEIGDYYLKQHVERQVAQIDTALKFVTGNLPSLREQLRQTEQQMTRARSARGTFDMSAEGRLTLEQSRGLQATLLDLQRKRQDLSASYLSQHPVMQALDAQIRAVNSQLAHVGGRIHTMPALEQELVSLNREIKVNSDLYVSLLASAQQLGLARQMRGANIRVVDAARVPEEPIGPPAGAILGFGATGGLVLGVSFALLRAGLRRGVTDPAQIEEETCIPVLTAVPMSPHQRSLSKRLRRPAKDSRVLALQFPMDPAVDSLRSMLTLLPYATPERESNMVVITGPTHSVGKSFVSLNLAAVAGASGARVLLVDGDLHKGTLAKSVRVGHGSGLTDLLAGRAKFDEVVHRDVMPNLDFLSAGHLAKNAPNVFWPRVMREALKEQLAQYDTVIVDSPPVLAAADSVVLSQQASSVFLVARSEVTSMRQIHASTKFLRQRGVHVKGVIFSGVDTSKRQNDLYGYGYGYLTAR